MVIRNTKRAESDVKTGCERLVVSRGLHVSRGNVIVKSL